MSTLAMRNYGLVLPKNYVSIEKDEKMRWSILMGEDLLVKTLV